MVGNRPEEMKRTIKSKTASKKKSPQGAQRLERVKGRLKYDSCGRGKIKIHNGSSSTALEADEISRQYTFAKARAHVAFESWTVGLYCVTKSGLSCGV